MSEHSSPTCTCPNRDHGGPGPLLAVLAIAGLTTAAVLIARRVRESSVGQTAEDLLARCDEAARLLDHRMSSGSGLSLAG